MSSSMSYLAQVRAFNRHWTEVLGLLNEGLLSTKHSLAEARVLFELAQGPAAERSALRERLGMDASFLTRVLARLKRQGLVKTCRSAADGRAQDILLTAAGRKAFAELNRRSARQIRDLLKNLNGEQQASLAEAMSLITQLVPPHKEDRRVVLRNVRRGDLGWIVQRHGAVYHDEYGWGSAFEAIVARIVADFHENFQPDKVCGWIAEVNGARAGSIFCCQQDEHTAQLRVLLVEPWARGLGIGRRLVSECVSFARAAGYARMVLWTNSLLLAARSIYEQAGFRLKEDNLPMSFDKTLIAQVWELDLRGS